MNLKKITAVLTVGVLFFGMAGCSKSSSNSETEDTSSTPKKDKITLHLEEQGIAVKEYEPGVFKIAQDNENVLKLGKIQIDRIREIVKKYDDIVVGYNAQPYGGFHISIDENEAYKDDTKHKGYQMISRNDISVGGKDVTIKQPSYETEISTENDNKGESRYVFTFEAPTGYEITSEDVPMFKELMAEFYGDSDDNQERLDWINSLIKKGEDGAIDNKKISTCYKETIRYSSKTSKKDNCSVYFSITGQFTS